MLIKTVSQPQYQMTSFHYEFVNDKIEGKKAKKSETINKATVEVGGVSYDADEVSMDRMGRVINAAYGQALQAISTGTDAQTAASDALGTTVSWKCADDVVRDVTVSTLVDVLDAAKNNMSNIWID